MNAVYTVWSSEDDGFRFPYDGVAYATFEVAKKVAEQAGAIHLMDGDDERLQYCGAPDACGDVVAVYSTNDRDKSVDDALEHLRDNKVESLYAIDWVFILKIPVKETA